ncbi:21808_t:CDS:2, partial [Gigaspora rosea]
KDLKNSIGTQLESSRKISDRSVNKIELGNSDVTIESDLEIILQQPRKDSKINILDTNTKVENEEKTEIETTCILKELLQDKNPNLQQVYVNRQKITK